MSTGKWLMFLKVRAKEGSANPVFLVQAIHNTSSANVPGVTRDIEIWRVAALMINRYADEAEANSFMRAEELRPKGESRRSAPKLPRKAITLGRLFGVGSQSRSSSLPTPLDRRTDNALI
jgi:hypothetical protein